MRRYSSLLSLLVNFLLGASWAFSFLGASFIFYIISPLSVFYAIIGAFLGSLPGLFFVLLIEYFLMREEKLAELKKQTKLLEELIELNKNR